jgi:hypothetical protein
MTDTALPTFEGRDVKKSQLRITGAGDGLSEALALTPKAYHAGETMCLVLKAEVTQINHKAEKDSDDMIRVHTAVVGSITEVEEGDISSFLADSSERIRKARDAAVGQEALDLKPSRKPTAPDPED